MKFVMDKPQYLKDSINIISGLVAECRIKFSNKGIRLLSSDPANVCMVMFRLLDTSFSKIECDKEQEIGLSIIVLKDILRKCGEKDIIILEDLEDGRFQIKIQSKVNKVFKMPTIDIDKESIDEPNPTFDCVVKMKSNDLNDAIDAVSTFSESFHLIANKKTLIFKADNKGNDSVAEIKDADIKNEKEEVESGYSIDYLEKLIVSSKISEDVTLSFGQVFPLKLEYKSADKIQLSFILAPRVEND